MGVDSLTCDSRTVTCGPCLWPTMCDLWFLTCGRIFDQVSLLLSPDSFFPEGKSSSYKEWRRTVYAHIFSSTCLSIKASHNISACKNLLCFTNTPTSLFRKRCSSSCISWYHGAHLSKMFDSFSTLILSFEIFWPTCQYAYFVNENNLIRFVTWRHGSMWINVLFYKA